MNKSDYTIRAYRGTDDVELVSLWNRTLTRDPIHPDLFRFRTLLDPNFKPEGCLLAEAGGKLVGFILAVGPGVAWTFGTPPGVGKIVGMGVDPGFRRKGLGKELLEKGMAYLKGRGCKKINVAAHEYYAAGVDKEAYKPGIALLSKLGFKESYEAVAMGRLLYELDWPEKVREKEAELKKEGIEAVYYEPKYNYAVLEYFKKEFSDWQPFFERKITAKDDWDEIVIVMDKGKCEGYCQHLDTDHVGPFGTAESMRSKGVGSVMLYRLLDRMREKGYKFCWFGETGRAQPYYERAKFFVTRKYACMSWSQPA